MNIYFACSITGGRQDETAYQAIVNALLADGHEVPTAILASPEMVSLETMVDPVDVYTRDIAWIEACDALIAEVSTPSHGVGYEISYALSISKPVLCIYLAGLLVSKMIVGNTHPNLNVDTYCSSEGAVDLVREFLSNL